MTANDGKPDKTPSFGKVLTSVLAGFFGVQSNKRRSEDFTHGKPAHYIGIGLVVTVVFIAAVWGVVTLVVHLANS